MTPQSPPAAEPTGWDTEWSQRIGVKLLETGELEQGLVSLEAAVLGEKALPESVFDLPPVASDFPDEEADE